MTRSNQQVERNRSNLIWIILGIFVLGVLGLLALSAVRPDLGEEVPILTADHVPEGEQPGPYNSNPPSSGPHYATSFQAGFYDQSIVDDLSLYPEGYLVHNLEHGYVIFWYNCQPLTENECDQLVAELQEVIDRNQNFKVIAFPWGSISEPVVATSWGRILRFDRFNVRDAIRFVNANLNEAPEPNAP